MIKWLSFIWYTNVLTILIKYYSTDSNRNKKGSFIIAKIINEHIVIPNNLTILDEASITLTFFIKSKNIHH